MDRSTANNSWASQPCYDTLDPYPRIIAIPRFGLLLVLIWYIDLTSLISRGADLRFLDNLSSRCYFRTGSPLLVEDAATVHLFV